MASEECDQLLANLRRLQLRHAANNLDDLLRDASRLKLGHLGFLARVVENEVLARTETATVRRIREAHFPEICRIEDYDFKLQACLDRKIILDLAELGFLDRCEAVFFLGPSGVGKSHLSIGLGIRACAAGYGVHYVRAYDMLKQLLASIADETFDDVLESYCRPALLILDEVGNHPANPAIAEHNFAGVFYEIVHQRHRHGSTILASNLGVNDWAAALGGPPGLVATALDRLLEGAHIIAFPPESPSYRTSRERGPGPLPRPRPRRRRDSRTNAYRRRSR
ncbi:MAG: ATP-binding protein [Phycisphaerales bacterium]|nr:MAG: ATP-binding protein [Phycisphaerales bacterium]